MLENFQVKKKDGDFIVLPIIKQLRFILNLIETIDTQQKYSIIDNIIVLASLTLYGELVREEFLTQLKFLAKDVIELTDIKQSPMVILTVLREAIETYGSIIETNHIPIQDIKIDSIDANNIYIHNKAYAEE